MKLNRLPRSAATTALRRAFFKAIYPKPVPKTDASRRRFLRQAGVLAAATSVAGCGILSPKNLSKQHRIAVVGAGVAGLNATWQLRKKGIWADVFEASQRTGGRMFTVRDVMAPGLTTDFGGEFVDTVHEDMRQLCAEFDLTFWDTGAASEADLHETGFFFEGRHFSEKEAIAAMQPFAQKLQKDIDRIPESLTRHNAHTVQDLDNVSASEYLTRIGCSGWIRTALEMAVLTEYGMEPSEQSAINLLFTMSVPKVGDTAFDVFAESDERYKIKGGSQALTDRMTTRLEEHIRLSHRLTKITRKGLAYTLSFANGNSYEADAVVMTLPFTVLREIDVGGAGFSPLKMKAIRELGYGSSAKLMLGFHRRIWREQGYAGNIYADNSLQCGWDNARMQAGAEAGFTAFLGGNIALQLVEGSPVQQAAKFLPRLDAAFPGMTAAHNGQVARMHWPSHEFSKGGYSCYKTGQFSSICGVEGEPEGRVFFAGEHCSLDFQGYMNGAAETGRKAAEAVLKVVSGL